MQNILSSFLNAGLLPIGEDDEKLKLLDAAATELAKKLNESALLVYRFVLVALYDKAKATDPVLLMAEAEVKSKWSTIVNKLGPSPIQVYRAVILRAVEIAATENNIIKGAAQLIASNEPTLHSQGKERDIIEALMAEFSQSFETKAYSDWIAPINLTVSKLIGKAKKALLTKEALTLAVAASVGPVDKAGKAIVNSNPHWPDVGQEWAIEYSSRISDGLFNILQNYSKSIVDELQEAIRETLAMLVDGFERSSIRDAKSELLWLKFSMFSPSGGRSFRGMSPNELLFHAVMDIAAIVSPHSPPSVEYFLRELVGNVSSAEMPLKSVLSDFGHRLQLPETATRFSTIFEDSLVSTGRRSWLDLALRPSLEENFEDEAGVSINHTEQLGEYAVKFYKEIQARKILSSLV